MRFVFGRAQALALFLVVAAAGAGCAPECVLRCESMRDQLIDNFGVDAETVCTEDAIVAAQGCDACMQAIRDTYNVEPAADLCSAQ